MVSFSLYPKFLFTYLHLSRSSINTKRKPAGLPRESKTMSIKLQYTHAFIYTHMLYEIGTRVVYLSQLMHMVIP